MITFIYVMSYILWEIIEITNGVLGETRPKILIM